MFDVASNDMDYSRRSLSNEKLTDILNDLNVFVTALDLNHNSLKEMPYLSDYQMLDTLNKVIMSKNKIDHFYWQQFPQQASMIDLSFNELINLPTVGKYDFCLEIKTLRLSNNRLLSLPDISHLPLRGLDVYQNDLTEVREEYLPVLLEILDIGDNQIKSLPDLSHLPLIELSVSGNNLTELNAKHLPLTLERLWIGDFQIKSLPDLSHLPLIELGVRSNDLNQVPEKHLPGTLKRLYIHGNQMKSLPKLSGLSLIELHVSGKHLTEARVENLPTSLNTMTITDNQILCQNLSQILKTVSVICQ